MEDVNYTRRSPQQGQAPHCDIAEGERGPSGRSTSRPAVRSSSSSAWKLEGRIRCRRWIRSTEGGTPSGTLGAVASEDGCSPGKRDMRVLTTATARTGVSQSRNIVTKLVDVMSGVPKGEHSRSNLLQGGLVKTREILLEGSPAPEARGKGALKGEEDSHLADDVVDAHRGARTRHAKVRIASVSHALYGDAPTGVRRRKGHRLRFVGFQKNIRRRRRRRASR